MYILWSYEKGMKATLLAGLLAISPGAFALDSCMAGNWYDPSQEDGRGLDISFTNKNTIGLAHFYTWAGTERMTFVFLGNNVWQDVLYFDTYQTIRSENGTVETLENGRGSIVTLDNDTIKLEYIFVHDHTNVGSMPHWCLKGWCSLDVVYTRLTQPVECDE